MTELATQILLPPHAGRGFVLRLVIAGDAVYGVGGNYFKPTLLATSDGIHVYPRPTPKAPGLRDLVIVGGRTLLCGEGVLAVAEDDMHQWEALPFQASAPLMGMKVDAAGCVWIGAYNGEVLCMSDDLSSAQKVTTLQGNPTINHVARHGDRLYFIGRGVWVMEPDGSFHQLPVGNKALLCDLAGLGDDVLVVVGDQGAIFRSTDRGISWAPEKCPAKVDLEAVRAWNGRLVAVGDRGTVVMSDERGARWTQIKTALSGHLWSVADAGNGLFVGGEAGMLARLVIPGAPDPWAGRVDRFERLPDPPTPEVAAPSKPAPKNTVSPPAVEPRPSTPLSTAGGFPMTLPSLGLPAALPSQPVPAADPSEAGGSTDDE